jgi:hypothetical protein
MKTRIDVDWVPTRPRSDDTFTSSMLLFPVLHSLTNFYNDGRRINRNDTINIVTTCIYSIYNHFFVDLNPELRYDFT